MFQELFLKLTYHHTHHLHHQRCTRGLVDRSIVLILFEPVINILCMWHREDIPLVFFNSEASVSKFSESVFIDTK